MCWGWIKVDGEEEVGLIGGEGRVLEGEIPKSGGRGVGRCVGGGSFQCGGAGPAFFAEIRKKAEGFVRSALL